MDRRLKTTPRRFGVGERTISDFGLVLLDPGEMISVGQDEDGQCDVTATPFGFYLGSSDVRMRDNGFRVALVENGAGKKFVMAVLKTKMDAFQAYLAEEQSHIILWLDEAGS